MSFGIERKKSDYTPIYDLGVGKSASVKQAKSVASEKGAVSYHIIYNKDRNDFV